MLVKKNGTLKEVTWKERRQSESIRMYRTSVWVRETGNVSDDRRLKAIVTSVPKRGLQLECGKSHHGNVPRRGSQAERREFSGPGTGGCLV